MYYRIGWQKTGSPLGFVVVRWDLYDNAWWVVNATDGQRVQSLAGMLASLPNPWSGYAGFKAATEAASYEMQDHYGTLYLATHYQVLQCVAGSVSPPITSAPAWHRPEDADGNTIADNIVYLHTPYWEDPQVDEVVLYEPSASYVAPTGPKLGSLRALTRAEAQTKQWSGVLALMDGTVFGEVKGGSSVRFKTGNGSAVRIRDVAENILVNS